MDGEVRAPVKLKYALPVVQMALALALLQWNSVWDRAAQRICDMPKDSPAFHFLLSLNAPVALVQALWNALIYGSGLRLWPALILEWAAITATIGLFWHWVALNIHSWRSRRTVVLFRRRPVRLACDLLLIVDGASWGLYGAGNGVTNARFAIVLHGSCFGPTVWAWWLPVVSAGLYFAWAAILIYVFGRDLVQCVSHRTRASEPVAP